MKIILSRKGFDSLNGGCASPIMPDGTLLSLPIPSKDKLTYADIAYQGLPYDQLLKQLNPQKKYHNCHLDPDIYQGLRTTTIPPNWQPAFGQIGGPQGELQNHDVGKDDLFLFFGWFRQVRRANDGSFGYATNAPELHVIFGYLQVERVLTKPEEIASYNWHPHADSSRCNDKSNALYLARKTLSFDKSKPGWGVLDFSEKRILTMQGCSKATWREIPALMPENIVSKRKNNAKNQGIYYQGIWQELILKENSTSEQWANSVLL